MHPVVFLEFQRIIRTLGIKGSVLEVGAVPRSETLLAMPELSECERVGVNLNPQTEFGGFKILKMNGNDMSAFPNNRFDAVVSNATLEHDARFWKTCAEVRRVLKPGGVAVLGAPGFDPVANLKALGDPIKSKGETEDYENATLTFKLHGAPYDYYRFSKLAVREVWFTGYRDVEVVSVMKPPRIIGWGWKKPPSP
jgi:SAM-dependent methyltransferase